jgi:hypothetical protein
MRKEKPALIYACPAKAVSVRRRQPGVTRVSKGKVVL